MTYFLLVDPVTDAAQSHQNRTHKMGPMREPSPVTIQKDMLERRGARGHPSGGMKRRAVDSASLADHFAGPPLGWQKSNMVANIPQPIHSHSDFRKRQLTFHHTSLPPS